MGSKAMQGREGTDTWCFEFEGRFGDGVYISILSHLELLGAFISGWLLGRRLWMNRKV